MDLRHHLCDKSHAIMQFVFHFTNYRLIQRLIQADVILPRTEGAYVPLKYQK